MVLLDVSRQSASGQIPHRGSKAAARVEKMSHRKKQLVALAIAKNQQVVDTLDQVLRNPGDRAYVVCTATSCRHYERGHCKIFTVASPPLRGANGLCDRYERVA